MDIEKRIREIASELFSFLKEEKPSFFDKSGWKGKVVEWSMRDESFKVQLLRFIDVLPALKRDEVALRVFREYLDEAESAPSVLRQGADAFARVPAWISAPIIRTSVRSLARLFIAGANPKDAWASLDALRREGASLSVDLLGEAVVSDVEARRYAERYMELLNFLAPRFPVPENDTSRRDRLDISLKISSFYSQMEPLNWEGSIEKTTRALLPVLEKAQALGASVTFDMEHSYFKDLIIAIFKNVLSEFKGFPRGGIALQAYLKDTKKDLMELVEWAKEHKQRIAIRLVKGAYWDHETVVNRQKGWPVPVFLNKEETDRNYETLTEVLLKNAEFVYPAIATHNIRSISNALAMAEELSLPPDDFEFQALYGMADPVRRALKRMAVQNPVRVYCPIGELIPGMAYLVRRILENTSNESFFRKSFAEDIPLEELIQSPKPPHKKEEGPREGFSNEATTDFSHAENRRKIKEALAAVKKEFGKEYPLSLGKQEVFTEKKILSINPARPDEIVGRVSTAAKEEAEQAIEAAKKAQRSWGETPADERAAYLFKAAAEMRKRKFLLTALEVYETGKTIMEADSDVAEAVDYLEYYGRQMIELSKPRRLGRYPGEINEYIYEPKGIGVVISPWNFPLAIPTGMASAAIVSGNCAIIKPSGLSPVIAWQLMDIFKTVGLPPGVLQYLPGPGAEVGEFLVSHPEIDFIAFTGSKEVGLRIAKRAAETLPGQRNVKRVVAEMGGKNAIIIDDSADLDEAVKGVLESALGYQGQKCSACSRLIVLPDAYKEFSERLTEAMKSIVIGPPEEPSTFMGPLIDQGALKKVGGYREKGKQEGKTLLLREAGGEGYYLGPALFEVGPDASIAQEEIFGPVLSLMRAKDIDEAIAIANGTEYALTGGIYSRSPANIEKAKKEFRVGNLYINRKITGALVGRQPFGGSGMSGVGSKAGGPDYLPQFMNPKTVSENTMRKGVAPEREE